MREEWAKNGQKDTSFGYSESTRILLGMTRNDSEWLGMDKNLSLNFFTRNEVGIWSDSYHSGWIRSECVGEGKVLSCPYEHTGFYTCCTKVVTATMYLLR